MLCLAKYQDDAFIIFSSASGIFHLTRSAVYKLDCDLSDLYELCHYTQPWN